MVYNLEILPLKTSSILNFIENAKPRKRLMDIL
jgi:hypothetical protein